jgi:hypothetical protein
LDHRGQNSGVSRDETSGGMIGAMVVCGVAVCAVERHGARWQRARARRRSRRRQSGDCFFAVGIGGFRVALVFGP